MGTGRKKIEMRRIEDKRRCQVTFAKRRQNLFKKANDLDTLCGSETAVVSVSSTGKVYSAGRPSLLRRFLIDSSDWNELDQLRRAVEDAMSSAAKNKNKEEEEPPLDLGVVATSSSRGLVCFEEPAACAGEPDPISFEGLFDEEINYSDDHSFTELFNFHVGCDSWMTFL